MLQYELPWCFKDVDIGDFICRKQIINDVEINKLRCCDMLFCWISSISMLHKVSLTCISQLIYFHVQILNTPKLVSACGHAMGLHACRKVLFSEVLCHCFILSNLCMARHHNCRLNWGYSVNDPERCVHVGAPPHMLKSNIIMVFVLSLKIKTMLRFKLALALIKDYFYFSLPSFAFPAQRYPPSLSLGLGELAFSSCTSSLLVVSLAQPKRTLPQ